jgi:hypothetical protein
MNFELFFYPLFFLQLPTEGAQRSTNPLFSALVTATFTVIESTKVRYVIFTSIGTLYVILTRKIRRGAKSHPKCDNLIFPTKARAEGRMCHRDKEALPS